MKTRSITGLLLLQMLLLGAPSMTSAVAPPLLPVQGYLTDDADMPLTGVYKVSFTLFDANAAGSMLFTTTEPVTVNKGRFSVYLGDKQQLQLDKLHHSNAVWLEVTIVQSCGSDATCAAPTAVNKTLTPRLQFATAAFAASAAFCSLADDAQSLGGMSAAELQPRIADTSCGPNQFVSSFKGGMPTCTNAPMASTMTGTAPAQSSLPDVSCPTGQLLSGIQGGQAVCVPRPADGKDGAPGTDGRDGVNGKDGTSAGPAKVQTIRTPFTAPAYQSHSDGRATCPAGTKLIGGGCACSSTSQIFLIWSSQSSNGESWYCRYRNEDVQGVGNVTVEATAICMGQ